MYMRNSAISCMWCFERATRVPRKAIPNSHVVRELTLAGEGLKIVLAMNVNDGSTNVGSDVAPCVKDICTCGKHVGRYLQCPESIYCTSSSCWMWDPCIEVGNILQIRTGGKVARGLREVSDRCHVDWKLCCVPWFIEFPGSAVIKCNFDVILPWYVPSQWWPINRRLWLVSWWQYPILGLLTKTCSLFAKCRLSLWKKSLQ